MLVVETAVKIGGRISRLQVRISGSTFTSSTCEGCLERLRLWSLLALHRLDDGPFIPSVETSRSRGAVNCRNGMEVGVCSRTRPRRVGHQLAFWSSVGWMLPAC